MGNELFEGFLFFLLFNEADYHFVQAFQLFDTGMNFGSYIIQDACHLACADVIVKQEVIPSREREVTHHPSC
jgi:hypothetical protein